MVGKGSNNWLIAHLGVVAVFYTRHRDLFPWQGLGALTHLTHVWVCSAARV